LLLRTRGLRAVACVQVVELVVGCCGTGFSALVPTTGA